MIKEWSDEAWEEFLEQVKKDRNFLKRIEKILKDIERNGYIGVGELTVIIGLSIRLKIMYWK